MKQSTKSRLFNPSKALEDTLLHASEVCRLLSSNNLLDEETITGAMLGALAAAYPLIAKSSGSPLGWHRFNKSAASNSSSEAANGADFALTLLDENGNAHVAVFQAKRSAVEKKNKRWRVDVRHNVTDASGKPSTQMVALESLGLILLALNSNSKVASPIAADLGWIHYLLYGPGTPVCIPLNDMTDALNAERDRKGSANYFYFSPEACASIMDVLQDGANPQSDRWLSIRTKAFFEGLPVCVSLMPVIAVGTSKAWEHVPENRGPPQKKDWRKPKMPKPARGLQ